MGKINLQVHYARQQQKLVVVVLDLADLAPDPSSGMPRKENM